MRAFLLIAGLGALGCKGDDLGPRNRAPDEVIRPPADAVVPDDGPTDAIDAPPPPIDAGAIDAALIDAVPAQAAEVSCYTEGAPNTTCASPAYCCFDNYTAQRNGFCAQTEACVYGTIRCDGPEDCGNGERCCATARRDPNLGTTGYELACRAGTCGGGPFDFELCHATATCATGACVTAYGNATDLPRRLSVCQ